MQNNVIEVRDLQKTYRSGLIFRKKVEALRGVSFEVGKGEIFGLLGQNGAGKTTLIKILLGIVRKSTGDAWMLGKRAGEIDSRRLVGYLPEHHRIPRHLTGNTALEYYGQLSGMPLADVKERRPQLLEMVGLDGWGDSSITKYSKGMQQRLGLAQAMLHNPELLILDEPTDGVDPKGRAKIREVLRALQSEGRTILINSHLLQELELICERVAILDYGRAVQVGKLSDLTSNSDASTVFTVSAEIEQLRPLLAKHGDIQCTEDGSETIRFTSPVDDQQEIDALVDTLRSNGISIVSMVRNRQTLEQVFLNQLKDGSGKLN